MKSIFRGSATALITTTNESGIDYDAYGKLIEWQISEGTDALCVAVTTGESATLSDVEHKELISFAVDKVAGRVPVIAGTGSNNTQHAIELSKYACEAGADALLVVTPYYNKCTQGGLVKTFSTIADAATKPLILYNVPSRTGLNIAPETYDKLADHGNIAGIKEANGNISEIAETARLVGDRLDIYSGNDDQIVPILSLGGKGVISVLANVLPKQTSEMCKKFFDGDVKGALDMQLRYLALIHQLFCEVNPIPVKAAMADLGFCENFVRLPLTVMTEAKHAVLKELLKAEGLKVN